MPGKMHTDEFSIDTALVRQLIAGQMQQWADLPIMSVPSAGTDNALFRLGDALVVRLPRRPNAVLSLDKETHWLPRLAPHLPYPIPEPVAVGAPGESFPHPWYVYRWLNGQPPSRDPAADHTQLARELAAFITALQHIDTTDGPAPGAHNFGRGVPLADRDTATRAAIAELGDRVDAVAVTQAWEAALTTPAWDQPPVWIHGDLQAGNLLVKHGHLSAVIDFGGLGVGDPACDLQIAWNLFTGAARRTFREALAVEDAMWVRGKGWALSVALIALPYYWDSNPALATMSRFAIAQILAESSTR